MKLLNISNVQSMLRASLTLQITRPNLPDWKCISMCQTVLVQTRRCWLLFITVPGPVLLSMRPSGFLDWTSLVHLQHGDLFQMIAPGTRRFLRIPRLIKILLS